MNRSKIFNTSRREKWGKKNIQAAAYNGARTVNLESGK